MIIVMHHLVPLGREYSLACYYQVRGVAKPGREASSLLHSLSKNSQWYIMLNFGDGDRKARAVEGRRSNEGRNLI